MVVDPMIVPGGTRTFLTRMDGGVEPDSLAAFLRRRARHADLPALPLAPLIAEYTATFGSTWRPVTRRKHADDFARLIAWLEANRQPVTTASPDFMTLVDYVGYLRVRPKVSGVWRGGPDALGRSLRHAPVQTLSANSVNAYMRPLRSLAIWLVDEGLLALDPFRRSRRRAALNPLLPSEETPTKSATLEDIRALEAGCAESDRSISVTVQSCRSSRRRPRATPACGSCGSETSTSSRPSHTFVLSMSEYRYSGRLSAGSGSNADSNGVQDAVSGAGVAGY
jgi:hypothetical protein